MKRDSRFYRQNVALSFGDDADEHDTVTHNGMGLPLHAVTVEDLLTLEKHEHVTDNETNRATWAYLSHLPWMNHVILYFW